MASLFVLCAAIGCTLGADPKHYYEDVTPSDWKPETPETCTELHRRAYCGHADAVFPVLFVVLVGAACFFQWLSPGLLLLALPVVFVIGLQVLVVSGWSHDPHLMATTAPALLGVICLPVKVLTLGYKTCQPHVMLYSMP